MKRLGLPLAIWLLAASAVTGASIALLHTDALAENSANGRVETGTGSGKDKGTRTETNTGK
jgi:hypothetical protein